jgi:hypothetical protein
MMEESQFKQVSCNSERIEPAAAHCLGVWFHNCEIAKALKDKIKKKCEEENRDMTFQEMLDSEQFFRECTNMWYGVKALNRLSIATRGAVHFGVAISNEQRKMASYIKDHLGFCPIIDKDKAKERGFMI